jgi:hypothetical protein
MQGSSSPPYKNIFLVLCFHKYTQTTPAKMNAFKLLVLDILDYINIRLIRSSTGRARDELVQIYLGNITSCDPEATEPPLGVYPWYASDPESYTRDTFQSTFRLRAQRCWDYYGDPDNVEPRLPPEPYNVDPKLCSFFYSISLEGQCRLTPSQVHSWRN